jgi:alkyl sulfatase BDS1-like metallo-beta-lactamase superfamily hydrolase
LPEALTQRWHGRGYYGTVSHNVKAIVQHYLSWYDAHPANLHALPPVAAARRYVDYMGGADAVLERARADHERGEFRWVAEVMKHLVYAEPANRAARELAASALEQMGFQAESATWRNAYLLAAHEYRDGPPPAQGVAGLALMGALSNELLFDALAVRVNAPRAHGLQFALGWHFSDSGEHWLGVLSNGALSSLRLDSPGEAALRITTDRATLDAILQQRLAPPQALADGRLRLDGQIPLLAQFFGLLDRFEGSFPVVDAAPWPV